MPITEPTIGQTNWGTTLNAALTQLDTVGASNGYHTQTTSGAVTIDASTGQVQNVTMSGNVTSSTITNASVGQRLTIMWRQDGTGTRTYVWPTGIKWAGGAAPAAGATTAGYVDKATLEFDGTNWFEVDHAMACH